MKTVVMCAALAVAGALCALEADYVEGEKSHVLVTPELQAAAEQLFGREAAGSILHAARLQMAKYDADMASQTGRRAWHGRLVGEVVDTNALVKVEIYSNAVDGAVWRYRMPFKPAKVKATTRRTTYSTNGVPARLAAARAARAAEVDAGVVVTNVEVTANAPKAGE